MKKLLLFFAATVVLITGCGKYDDDLHVCKCIYTNNSSSTITIYVDRVNVYEENILFEIPVGKSYTLMFGNSLPLSISEYITVSNGEKTITQTEANMEEEPNSLYWYGNYLVVSELSDGEETLLYVFDDSFFEDSDLIE